MITIYVLIALATHNVGGTPRPATWAVEFLTQERCEAAGEAMVDKFWSAHNTRVQYVCVPK